MFRAFALTKGKATFLSRIVVCGLLSGDFGAVGDSCSEGSAGE
jgi:hypothetical protein